MKHLYVLAALVFFLCCLVMPRASAQSTTNQAARIYRHKAFDEVLWAQSTTNQPARIYTKVPWAIQFKMKGTVTNVVAKDDKIHFQFSGWFYIHQYPWGTTNINGEVVQVDCRHGVSAVVSISDFVAMVPNVNAAAVRKSDDLVPIFKAAAERGRELTILLMSPKLDFAGQPFLQDAKIWKITDWDLR